MSHLKPLFWILHRNAKADVEEDIPEDLLTLIDRSITSIRIPEVDYSYAMINGMAVISIDFASNAEIVKKAIYG